MLVEQATLFAEFEGDRWFERNRDRLARWDSQRDLPLRLLDLYGVRPTSALEIGAANGYRLAAIAERFGAEVVAVEPSAAAIRDGEARFPAVRFVRGSVATLPIDKTSDVVIVHFVLHWVSRNRLLRAVAEIDRALVEGGFLLVGDFLPGRPTRVPYHHLPEGEAYTYKQNYAEMFLASGLYRQVGMVTAEHATQEPSACVPDDERIAVWLLRKDSTAGYAEAALTSS